MLASEQIKVIKKELKFKTSRSGGKGGQNVNKVETKVEIAFNIASSMALSERQKQRIAFKLSNKITDDGHLKLTEEGSRSQLENKETVCARLFELLEKALKIEKPRRATKPTKGSKVRSKESKKKRSDIKQSRKKII